eukprot:TRINITY_DN10609_c0_g1_i1.p1 TRINITY_DN10609_c0_g1~~TRINITY_DN10609_c0_g1_i1.p1  ORF type:complete len:258 (-),score=37.09 TRINITY_DN10609_c0_g1_i1:29-802(-)
MGLCKCRNITDLYCFVHKQAVCEGCICPDHSICVIGTYVEWLQDPDYDAPVCEVCKDEITEANVIRLTCLDMFHPECLDVHCSSFPPHTAKAGFTCPTCEVPVIPSSFGKSLLHKKLQKHLERASWLDTANSMLQQPKPPDIAASISPASPTTIVEPVGIGVRKTVAGNADNIPSSRTTDDVRLNFTPTFDDDDDKYNKHQFSKLFSNKESEDILPTTTRPPRKTKSSVSFNGKRVLIILALLSTLAIVFMMSMSLD